MSDANKTELTKRVTNAAVLWLEERGFRPVESEVTVARGWCADLAGFAYLSRTEAKNLKLFPPWPKRRPTESDEDHHHAVDAWNGLWDQLPSPITAAIEVKTSINDFKRDRKFKLDPPVHLLFLAMPRGLVGLPAIDERWGVLAYDEKGNLKRVRPSKLNESTIEQVLRVVVDIAMRRDNHTRYERLREFDRQAREHNNERENRHRISKCLELVLDVQRGQMSLLDCVEYHLGRRCKLPRYAMEQLEKLAPIDNSTPSQHVS